MRPLWHAASKCRCFDRLYLSRCRFEFLLTACFKANGLTVSHKTAYYGSHLSCKAFAPKKKKEFQVFSLATQRRRTSQWSLTQARFHRVRLASFRLRPPLSARYIMPGSKGQRNMLRNLVETILLLLRLCPEHPQ